jgi:glycerophosphoryl diester phosphodiesterase
MKKFRTVLAILKYNWKPLFQFELLYKLLALTAFTPLFSLSFRGIAELTGYSYLTMENIGSFLSNPIALGLIFVLFLLIAAYAVFDISAILFAIDQGSQHIRTDVQCMLLAAGRASLRMLRPRNWPIVILIVLLLPLLNIGVVSSYASTIAIPEAILESLSTHRLWAIPVGAGLLVVGILLLRWLYVFHFFLLEGATFSQARRQSAALGRGRHLQDLAAFLVLQAAFFLLFVLLTLGLIAVIVLIARLFAADTVLYAVLTSAVWVTLAALFLLFTVLSAPLGFCYISVLFYLRKTAREEPIRRCAYFPNRPPRRSALFRRIEAGVAILSVVCCSIYIWQIAAGNANFNIEYLRTTEVTAHRGASALYPENTMAAFRGAAELGADWIELDVQQTRDGQLIVMHDSNLRRTTGLNKPVWETDWSEVAALDAGSWFSPDFAGEPVPLLSQVLEFAKEADIRLNIELKPTGHEQDFAKSVVSLVESADYLDRCVITSQNYSILEEVKAYQPEAKTVYVMGVAYGNLLKLEAADAFSIKSINITAGMVSRLHNSGREIYA